VCLGLGLVGQIFPHVGEEEGAKVSISTTKKGGPLAPMRLNRRTPPFARVPTRRGGKTLRERKRSTKPPRLSPGKTAGGTWKKHVCAAWERVSPEIDRNSLQLADQRDDRSRWPRKQIRRRQPSWVKRNMQWMAAPISKKPTNRKGSTERELVWRYRGLYKTAVILKNKSDQQPGTS